MGDFRIELTELILLRTEGRACIPATASWQVFSFL